MDDGTVGAYLERIRPAAARMRSVGGLEPVQGSALDRQVAELGEGAGRYILDGFGAAVSRLYVAEEHLSALGKNLREGSTVYTIYTGARVTAELAARSWWFLEPGLLPINRARRGLADRRESLLMQMELPLSAVRSGAEKRLHAVERNARREGVSLDTKGDGWPDSTGLMDRIMRTPGAKEDQLGRLFYKLLSGYVHGVLYALTSMTYEPEESAPGGDDYLVRRQIGTTPLKKAQAVLIAVEPYRRAVGQLVALAGWDGRELEAHLRYMQSELMSVLR